LNLGEKGNCESSLVKVISSEGIWRVVDRSVQILGGQAMTDESVVCKIFKDARGFRIYDGANEVHRMSIAKKLLGKQA
ncbi:acyl-CoA dehydrogenase family protein, partial [Acinetobacter baumannii]